MNHSLTLEAVQKDFQHWRLSRKKRAAIPDDLWQRVLSSHLSKISKTTADISPDLLDSPPSLVNQIPYRISKPKSFG